MTDTTPRYQSGEPSARDGDVTRTLRRLNAQAWGIAVGALLGGGLFFATNFLIVKGGPNVGQHLQLLSVFLPGYRVSFVGSLIGFVYLFVVGYGIGRVIGGIYNWLIDE